MSRQSYRIRIVPWSEESGRIRSLREAVFVGEHGVPPTVMADALDDAADTVHVLASDEDGEPVAAGRIFRDMDIAWIARMAVLEGWRDQGVGHAVLSLLLSAASRWGVAEVHLHSPDTARRFYSRHGFREVGPEFVQGGATHIEMRQRLS